MCGLFLELNEVKVLTIDIIQSFSNKILLSNDDEKHNHEHLEEDKLFERANSYFYGLNDYPVNYLIALQCFQILAEKGNSEAQWRYALMVENSLGKEKDLEETNHYFQESSKQNNTRGKLLYSLFLRDNNALSIFQRLINECCNSGNLDAKYYYAMHLENIDETLEQSMNYYQEAADNGHLDSLIRLIYVYKFKSKSDLYEKYLNLSVSLLNETFLVKLILLYDRKKQYDQSNILIQFGIIMNYQLFNAFYADHLLFGKGIEIDVNKAEKIANLAFSQNYSQ